LASKFPSQKPDLAATIKPTALLTVSTTNPFARSIHSQRFSNGATRQKMVRIKERYLLVAIVYPEAAQNQARADLPDLLVYNQPTANACNARSIQYAIKAQITDLWGDFGAGAVERSLRGPLSPPPG
jgi:hypothetical protein